MGILAAGEDHDRKGGDGEREKGVVLERGVVVETGAVVEARWVGEGTVVEVGAKVGRGCIVGKVSFFFPLSSLRYIFRVSRPQLSFWKREGRGGTSGLGGPLFCLSICLSVWEVHSFSGTLGLGTEERCSRDFFG